jgi:hypothetical protein
MAGTPSFTVRINAPESSGKRLASESPIKVPGVALRCWTSRAATANAGSSAHPLAQRLTGEQQVEADMPDTPLLVVDGSNLLFRAWFVL